MKRYAAALALWLCASASGQSTRPAGPEGVGGVSVALPYGDFVKLIDARGMDANRPPVDYTLSAAAYTATVGARSVTATATCDLTVLGDRWALVPIGPADAGITAATLDGTAAALVVKDNALCVLASGKGTRKLAFGLERPLLSDAGSSRFELPVLAGPIVTLSATLPQVNLDVRGGATVSALTSVEQNNTTRVSANVQGGQTASVSWRQRAADAQQTPRLYANTQTLVSVERGLVRLTSTIKLQVERKAVSQVRLKFDPSMVVLNISGKDISRWAEENAAGGARSVLVTYAQPVEGELVLQATYERDLPDPAKPAALALPVVEVEGAKRDAGTAAVRADAGYDVRPVAPVGDAAAGAVAAMQRIGISELPAELRDVAGSQIAYRYGEAPATVSLMVERAKQLPPRIFANTMTRASIDRGVLRAAVTVQYEILHAGVDTLRLRLPAGVDVTACTGAGVRDTQTVTENNASLLVVGLKDLAKGQYTLSLNYEGRFTDADKTVAIPLVSSVDAAGEHGSVGVEVRAGYEVTPDAKDARRTDVRDLPEQLWREARSPLILGYRYDNPAAAAISLSVTRHEDVDVLVAMSDVCEVSTTYTPDGKCVTKMMFVLRNNLKQFMTLDLPQGAAVWSTLVDDVPVTPSKNAKGQVLIPLKKSERVEEGDQESYKAKRERRRGEQDGQQGRTHMQQLKQMDQDGEADLRPYDVEIVFVTPAVKFEDKGQIAAALPKVDVPTGHLAWAIFLPQNLRVVDSTGNVAEVQRFSLPFRHFGEAEWARKEAALQKVEQQAKAQEKMQQDAAKQLAEAAKASGVRPVRVEIPIVGGIHRFEKFLTVEEAPSVTLVYNRRGE